MVGVSHTTSGGARPKEPGSVTNPPGVSTRSPAHAGLAECRTVMEAKQIADIAEAARVYPERTHASVEAVNHATEVRLLAERQMGMFLKAMPKATGTKSQLVSRGVIGGRDEQPPISSPATLAEIGITKDHSARARKLADLPAQEFTERIAVAKASGGKLSMTKIVEERRVKSLQRVAAASEFQKNLLV